MIIVEKNITLKEIGEISQKMFGNLVKAEEALLLEKGSRQENLWGINIYPEFFGKDDFIEFDSMINLRPSQNNRSRGVGDSEIRKKILEITNKLISK